MGRAFSDITFTATVRDLQEQMGSREQYAGFDQAEDRRDSLGRREIGFIEAADHFYQATSARPAGHERSPPAAAR